MAIFGTLNELSLPEVLTMLGKRSGRLELRGLRRSREYDLYLEDSRLRALSIDGHSVSDMFFIREAMVELVEADEGEFEFKRMAPEFLPDDFDMPIHNLLLSTATAIDELGAYRSRFADPKTRFQTVPTADAWLDESLAAFQERANALLRRGVDAEELSVRLGVHLEQVQLNLHKLRSLGYVTPVRAYRAAALLAPAAAHVTTERSDSTLVPPSARAATQPRGLIRRMLDALSTGFRP